MQHLGGAWDQIRAKLEGQEAVLFLDYDGTLTPIAVHPRLAHLPLATKKVLRDLLKAPFLKNLVIVSGRSLKEIKRCVGVPGLVYVGNHGLEVEGPLIRFVHPEARRAEKLLRNLHTKLKQGLRKFRGTLIENKELTLSVHYRRLAEQRVPEAKIRFLKILRPYLQKSAVLVTEGKKVWEVRPPLRWHKGTVVLWLLARVMAHESERVIPLYVGDDQTDEDAFGVIKGRGIGIKVAEEPEEATGASYYLRSPQEVLSFLRRLKTLR